MDLSSAFKSEVFRPLMTLVIPGAVAGAPYVLLLRMRYDAVGQFWNDHTTAAFLIIALAAIGLGRILESLGSRLEVRWDKCLEARDNTHLDTWYRYLRLVLPEEPIGQRYLRTVTLALKFELAMIAALPVMYAGIMWLNTEADLLSNLGVIWCGILTLLLIAYLVFESWSSACILARVRQELVDEFYEVAG